MGTKGWSYSFWRGNFYPKGLATGEFLTEYSKHFDTVEVDSTFYRMPHENTVNKWKDQTSGSHEFAFAAKFPKIITHIKMLENCDEEVSWFIGRMSTLKEKLGPLLIQLPATFEPVHIERLSDFLPSLPKDHLYAVEVRNRKSLTNKLYSVLRDNGVALTMVDSPLVPVVEETTSDFAYVRWEGDRRKVSGALGRTEIDRTRDIEKWAKIINSLREKTAEVFGYFSKYYSGHPPTDARKLLQHLELTEHTSSIEPAR